MLKESTKSVTEKRCDFKKDGTQQLNASVRTLHSSSFVGNNDRLYFMYGNYVIC